MNLFFEFYYFKKYLIEPSNFPTANVQPFLISKFVTTAHVLIIYVIIKKFGNFKPETYQVKRVCSTRPGGKRGG